MLDAVDMRIYGEKRIYFCCIYFQDNYDMKKCLTNIRRSVVDLIGNTLRHWRRTQDSAIKNILLRRLQCLRAVAINLGALNTTKVPSTHPIYKQFSESITTLSNIWKTTVPTLRRRQNHTLDYENLWRRFIVRQWYIRMVTCNLFGFLKYVIFCICCADGISCGGRTHTFLLCQIERWYWISGS